MGDKVTLEQRAGAGPFYLFRDYHPVAIKPRTDCWRACGFDQVWNSVGPETRDNILALALYNRLSSGLARARQSSQVQPLFLPPSDKRALSG